MPFVICHGQPSLPISKETVTFEAQEEIVNFQAQTEISGQRKKNSN